MIAFPLICSLLSVQGEPPPPAPQATAQAPADWQVREAELLAEIARLEEALRESQLRAARRSQEWIEYVQALRSFELPALPAAPDFIEEALAPRVDRDAAAREARAAAARSRGSEILATLRALLMADGVRTIDLLDVGVLHDGPGGRPAVGPVVARVLDARGRLTGMFHAEHMTLEVSHSSRSVTLVLEDGYETRLGRRRTFDGVPLDRRATGEAAAAQAAAMAASRRRIVLPDVGTAAWVRALPDLIDGPAAELFQTDGIWDTTAVRATLGKLLRGATPAGSRRWSLTGLGGVVGTELRDVQLAELAPVGGRVLRRVFADRARIHAGAGVDVVELELLEGAVKSQAPDGGERTAPFLEGRFRVLLPAADLGDWRAAPIPRHGEAPPLPGAPAGR